MNESHLPLIDVFVRPDLRRKRISVRCDSTQRPQFRIDDVAVDAEVDGPEFHIPLADFTPWTPESPVVYSLNCKAGGLSTVVSFGMREFTVKDGRFFLNSRPVFLKSLHGRATELSEDGLTGEFLGRVRDAGFNFLWTDANVVTVDALRAADAIGVMLCVDLHRQDSDITSLVTKWRNHPSVVAWRVPEAAAEVVREVDPTRLVLSTRADPRTKRETPFYVAPYRPEWLPIDRLPIAQPHPLSALAESYIQHAGSPSNVSLLEFECTHSTAPPESPAPDSLGKMSIGRMLDQTGAARVGAQVGGYALGDGKLLRDEALLRALAIAQCDVRPIIRLERTNLVPRQTVGCTVLLINDARIEGDASLSLQVVGPTNQVLWKKKRMVRLPKHGKPLWEGSISASGATGPHAFVVRLFITGQPMIEERRDFHVFDKAKHADAEAFVVEPGTAYTQRCRPLMRPGTMFSPVIIVPPLANTVRAYPDNELAQVLGQASSGAVALFFEPPADWNDLADRIDPELRATSIQLPSGAGLVHHRNRLHPVFEGLPAGSVMDTPYRGVLPWRAFEEPSDEEIAQCMTGASDAATRIVGASMLVRTYGTGRVVFTHFRILDRLGEDPVADRMFVNMIQHFSRRAVPSQGTLPVHQKSVEWLRKERTEFVRKWKLIGMFPAQQANDSPLAPEELRDFNASYPGRYRDVHWVEWHTLASENHRIPFAAALDPDVNALDARSHGTAFAYAEFSAEQRFTASIRVACNCRFDLWHNDKPVLSGEYAGAVESLIRQGRNSVLLKVTSELGGVEAAIQIEVNDRPATLRWWR